MENEFHGLPPLKRFKLLQQNTHKKHPSHHAYSCLPAKKRIESSEPHTAYCLPAKKRVWAPQFFVPPLDTIHEENPTQEEQNPKENVSVSDATFIDSTENKPVREDTHFEVKAAGRDVAICPQSLLSLMDTVKEADPSQLEQKPKKKIPASFDLNVADDTEFDEESDEEDGIICSICQSTDGDPSDPIVFCDGCDLMVHASCYGNPLIQAVPEGDWFCAKCESAKFRADGEVVDCCLCPLKEGATKPTVDGRWAHVMCALLVPEVFFRDSEGRDGIDCSLVPQRRWHGVCYLCNSKSGCVIDCAESKCSSRFHVSCGLKEELCIEYKEGRTGGIVAGFCEAHTRLWKKQQATGKFKIVPMEMK